MSKKIKLELTSEETKELKETINDELDDPLAQRKVELLKSIYSKLKKATAG